MKPLRFLLVLALFVGIGFTSCSDPVVPSDIKSDTEIETLAFREAVAINATIDSAETFLVSSERYDYYFVQSEPAPKLISKYYKDYTNDLTLGIVLGVMISIFIASLIGFIIS